MVPQCSCGMEGTVPLHETVPLEVVALPGLWLPHGAPQSQFLWPPGQRASPHSRRESDVNKATEERERRCRRVADQRAAVVGPSARDEENKARGQGAARRRESESSGKMESSESRVVAATEAKPIQVYVPMISDLITDRVTHHQR